MQITTEEFLSNAEYYQELIDKGMGIEIIVDIPAPPEKEEYIPHIYEYVPRGKEYPNPKWYDPLNGTYENIEQQPKEDAVEGVSESTEEDTEKDIYVPLKAVSEMLGKDPNTIVGYIKKGRLIGKKKNSRWYVLIESAENYSPPERKHKKGTDPVQRKKALKRDGYKCQICGSTEDLHVHHREPRHLGGTDDLDNLVTECVYCHANEHKGEAVYSLMVSRFPPE